MDTLTTSSDTQRLQRRAVEAIRGYLAEVRPDGLREAAEALVDLRQHFTNKDGEVDWKGRSWPYREAVQEVYSAVGVDPDDLPSLQSAIRYHIGNVVRERLDDEHLRSLGLKHSGPKQRTREFRESRAALVKTIMPSGELDEDDVVRLVVMIDGVLRRVDAEIARLDRPHVIALRHALEQADSRLAGVRRKVGEHAG